MAGVCASWEAYNGSFHTLTISFAINKTEFTKARLYDTSALFVLELSSVPHAHTHTHTHTHYVIS